jgi:transposase
MQKLLIEARDLTDKYGGILPEKEIKLFLKRYRTILSKGNKECPLAKKINGTKGKVKQSKSRNLLDRLINFEEETLRFMVEIDVPFTNNQGENDLRMTKVHQKISGCFRSMDGAKTFCLIRSYLVTARKNGLSPTDALRLLFSGEIPNFMKKT